MFIKLTKDIVWSTADLPLKNIIVPTPLFIKFKAPFVNEFKPLGLLVPVFILYIMSSRALLKFTPNAASILFKFFSLNISSIFCFQSVKNSDLVTSWVNLCKSAAMFPTFQFSIGST